MGPTGKRVTLRAFIDEGADSSSITTRASKMLQLKALKQVVEVTAFGDTGTQQCKVANLTSQSLQSLLIELWGCSLGWVLKVLESWGIGPCRPKV